VRFNRLSLLKYGHHDNTVLEFPPRALDFQLILGANEAGKSTTLAAVSDLLFGFPRTSPYDFQFAAPLLRVGAALESGDQILNLVRRKGVKDTLLDEAGQPVPETILQSRLHGMDAQRFQLSHSLDHRRLREGGRAMMSAKGDVGLALFTAGSGLPSAQAVLDRLAQETSAIWGARSKDRSYWREAEAFKTAEAKLGEARIPPARWTEAKKALDEAQAALSALQEQRATAQASLRVLQRKRRLAAPAGKSAQLRAAVAAAGPVVLEPRHEKLHEEATAALREAAGKHQMAAAAIAQATAALANIAVDQRLLDHAADIDALVTDAGGARDGARDLPLRERELGVLRAEAERLARELGMEAAPLEAMLDRLPGRPALATLRRVLEARRTLETRRQEAATQLEKDDAAETLAKTRLAARAETAPLPEGAALACRHAQRLADLAARLPERRRALAREADALTKLQARLLPWTGTPAALEALRLPPEEETSAAEAALQTAAAAVETAARELLASRQGLAALELDRTQAASRPAVTQEALAEARAARDALWQVIAAHADGAQAAMAAYPEAVARADALADARFNTAEASARLADLDARIERAHLALDQAKERAQAAHSASEAAKAGWEQLLVAADLPPMPPASLRQWRADRQAVLNAVAQHRIVSDELAADAARVEAARLALLAALGTAASEAMPFERLLDTLEQLLDVAAKADKARETLRTQLQAATEAVTLSRKKLDGLNTALDTWEADWPEAVRAAGLHPIGWAALDARLPLFEQLRGALDQALAMQSRVSGITRDQMAFQLRATALAAKCGATDPELDPHRLTEAMRAALQMARENARVAKEQTDARARAQKLLAQAELDAEACRVQLAPLMALAEATDEPALEAAFERARKARALHAQLLEIESEILKSGDGHTLEHLLAEAEGADPDALAVEAASQESALAELDRQVAEASSEAGAARQKFQALDHGHDPAQALAEREQARAGMEAEAEIYLVKRAQWVMLNWAIETYRKRQQHPMLARASDLFKRLTLERYTRLDIDHADPPRLFAVRADETTTVAVEAMSDGTADQLFLALRLAALEQSIAAGVALPFLADDLFINFDDARARAGLEVLGELSRMTQVLFFTHHAHLAAMARDVLGVESASFL
jgi:uncharacterized protein YhaN